MDYNEELSLLINGRDDTFSFSTDSGIVSDAETRPSSSSSIIIYDNDTFLNGPELNLSNDHTAILSSIKQALRGMLSLDVKVLRNSCSYMFYICRSGIIQLSTLISHELLSNILCIFNNVDVNSEHEIMHCISGIFYHVTESQIPLYLLDSSNNVAIILNMLLFTLDSALYYSVAGIHNLLGRIPLSKNLRCNAITSQLLKILWGCFVFQRAQEPLEIASKSFAFASPNTLSKFLTILCDSLYLISRGNDDAKALIHVNRCMIPLLYFINTYSYVKFHWVCARLLRILSAHQETKLDILRCDCSLSFFFIFLNSPSSSVAINAYWTLRNLSDKINETSSDKTIGLLCRLIEKLEQTDKLISNEKESHITFQIEHERLTIIRCISGTLANMSCRNPFVKTFLTKNFVISTFSQLLTAIFRDFHSHLPEDVYVSEFIQSSTHNSALFFFKCASNFKILNDVDYFSRLNSFLSPTLSALFDSIKFNFGLRKPYIALHSILERFDFAEAALRCLSHLTSGHGGAKCAASIIMCQKEFITALTEFGALSLPRILKSIVKPFLPENVVQTFMHEKKYSTFSPGFIDFTSANDNFELISLLQLTKAWLSLIRNLIRTDFCESDSSKCSDLEVSVDRARNTELNRSELLTPSDFSSCRVQLESSVKQLGEETETILKVLKSSTTSSKLESAIESCQKLLDLDH